MKKFNLKSILAVLTDSKEKTFLLGLIGVILTLFGVPQNKQDVVIAAITALTSLLIIGQAYAEGKLNEGIVPPDAVDQILNLARALAGAGAVNSSHVQEAIGKWQQIQSAQSAPKPADPSVVPTVAKLLIVCLGLSLLFGCVTSKQFQAGAKQFVPDITSDARAMLHADMSLTPTQMSERENQLAKLDADVANLNAINRVVVTSDWNAFKSWYLGYVDADQSLDAQEKALRHDIVLRFDKVIADDAGRPFAKFATTQP